MSVYFVFRSQYSTPMLNHTKNFESSNLLEWFREIWAPIADFEQAKEYAQSLLGVHVYGFGSLFRNIAEYELAPPEAIQDLEHLLRKYLYFEGYLKFEPHVVQVVSNDDELDIAFYLFDDAYLESNREKADFPLLREWKLPNQIVEGAFKPIDDVKTIEPKGSNSGSLFCAFLSAYDCGDNIMGIEGAWKANGLRLPDLPKYLGTKLPGKDVSPGKEWPHELCLLRSQLLAGIVPRDSKEKRLLSALLQNPEKEAVWDEFLACLEEHGIEEPSIYLLQLAIAECCKFPVGSLNQISDWNFGQKQNIGVSQEIIRSAVAKNWNNDPKKSLQQCEKHVAQASIHTDQWSSWNGLDLFNRWILFDDLWAAANQGLANSILRYASRWDVLT